METNGSILRTHHPGYYLFFLKRTKKTKHDTVMFHLPAANKYRVSRFTGQDEIKYFNRKIKIIVFNLKMKPVQHVNNFFWLSILPNILLVGLCFLSHLLVDRASIAPIFRSILAIFLTILPAVQP